MIKITVGLGTCGISAGANKIYDLLANEIKSKKLEVTLQKVGCIGVCRLEPIVEIIDDDVRYTYVNVTEKDVTRIIDEHVIAGKVIEELIIDKELFSIIKTPFLKNQVRIALRNCGNIDPTDINEYIKNDGYNALKKVLKEMSSEEVIAVIKDSGLKGRGGAGFSTGIKWEMCSKSLNSNKYVCCNADEGDPGAFMDRSVLEGDPHSVIEAMTIAAYAIGANKGYIYVRAEYPLAVERIKKAIIDAKEKKFLGEKILNTDFSFNLDIRLGAGAFVCGEETALITSIEGNRGEPRVRPPYPADKGLFKKPTLLNNVETYANIAPIILNGSAWFSKYGTTESKGTKVFALGGKINNTGLIEVPMGTTLKYIIEELGGGIPNNKKFKMAQTGGPSGGCIPDFLIDTEMSYESLNAIGSMMGSGGLIIMDEDSCAVDIASFFLDFTVDESCGKCVPCRLGTKKMYDMLQDIKKGEKVDLDELQSLGLYIKDSALCGLGQSAPNPVLSTMRYFKDEYVEHINEKKCRAHVCKELIHYEILKDKCVGCSLCKRNCPADAITGNLKESHEIDQTKCLKCGICFNNCHFKAITKE